MSIVISIEGNIGAGKSTMIREIESKSNKDIVYIPEPIDEWNTIQDENKTPILECFYKNQEKYAFSFQMMAYISRIANLKKAIENNPNTILIIERSVYTDKHVFAKMLYDNKQINEIEHQIYLKWYDYFLKDLPPIYTIYMRTDPSVCLKRIQKRNRSGEEKIKLSYLKSCHDYHEDWIYTNIDVTNTIIINANKERNTDDDFHDIITLIGQNIDSWIVKHK